MAGLQIKQNDKIYTFEPDMTITLSGAAAGTWSATTPLGTPGKNGISYILTGAVEQFVPVKYAFNANNQLTLLVSAADGGISTTPTVYNGGLDIDSNDDIIYILLGPDDNLTQSNFLTVYGVLQVSAGAKQIVIDLTEGGQTQIKLSISSRRVEAKANDTLNLPGGDALIFVALTTNRLPDSSVKRITAQLTFTGKWDIQDSKLVFLSQIEGDANGVKAVLAFDGKFKGVEVGLQFDNLDGAPNLSFTVHGQHRWSQGDVAWNMSLGYSGQQFLADADADLQMNIGSGQTLSIKGGLKLVHRLGGDGTKENMAATSLQMNLSAAYHLDQPGRSIVFEADLSNSPTGANYNLFLEGTFKIRGGQLQFDVKFSNADGAAEASVELKFTGTLGSVNAAIDLLVSNVGGRPSVNFDISITYVDGVRLSKGNPIPVAP